MEDLLIHLVNAKQKKIFSNQEEFRKLLLDIQLSDPKLKLDWDDGAGEEWAIFFNYDNWKVYMINSKIGIVFVQDMYANRVPSFLSETYEVVIVSSFQEEIWKINLKKLQQELPEIRWISEKKYIIDSDCFSLDDFYIETV